MRGVFEHYQTNSQNRRRFAISLLIALTASAFAAEPRVVRFKTFDGVELVADYYAPPSAASAPIVFLLHMEDSNRASWKPLATALSRVGFAALAIDLRGHGEAASQAARTAVEKREPVIFGEMFQDVRAAYDWIAQEPGVDRSRFILVGAGMGANVALHYASEDRSVDGVIGLTPHVEFCGLNSRADLGQIQGRRVQLFAARQDRAEAELLAGVSKLVSAEFVDTQDRGEAMVNSPGAFLTKVVKTARELAGEPTGEPVFASLNSDVYHMSGSGWIETIKPTNLRYFSSSREAEDRGLRRAKSRKPSDFRAKGE